MLSPGLAPWLAGATLLLGIVTIGAIIALSETYTWRSHNSGMEKISSMFRWLFFITLTLTFFYSLASLQTGYKNETETYKQQIKSMYGLELTTGQMNDLISEDENGIKINGKHLIAVNHKDSIMVLEYKDNHLQELTKLQN